MLRILLLFFALLGSLSLLADDAKYHKVPALTGDGVFSLLRRYKLDRHSCNHKTFYELNNLKAKSHLKVGRYYYIPVLIYQFNGKTIRSSIGIDNWTLAKSIESYNETMVSDGYREKSFKKDKVLWVPHHMLNCADEDIPAAAAKEIRNDPGEINLSSAQGGTRRFPIFGKAYEKVPLESTRLQGRVYYVVSGHGGPDPGAMGKKSKHTLCEDEYAYDVALRLARLLIANGATVYMVVRDPNDGIRGGEYLNCDYDEVVWGDKKIFRQQKARLAQRSGIINKLYEKHKKQGVVDQVAIMIHVDSRSNRTQTDLFFYYHATSSASKTLALKLQKVMKAKYKKYRASGRYDGAVTARDLHMLRETKPKSVYVELGNIRNSFDQKRIVVESNRVALAKWLYEGLSK